jgi:hypothetical protein
MVSRRVAFSIKNGDYQTGRTQSNYALFPNCEKITAFLNFILSISVGKVFHSIFDGW